jgi:hypothetical protein
MSHFARITFVKPTLVGITTPSGVYAGNIQALQLLGTSLQAPAG